MIFNEPLFGLFFGLLFCLYWFVLPNSASRVWLLLLANMAFYASWDVRFVPVFFAVAFINYWAGVAIEREKDDAKRKRPLVIAVAVTILILVGLKYLDFFAQSGVSLLGFFGAGVELGSLGIAAPLGISFFTLSAMSYPIDVYRRQFDASKEPLHFLATVSFFPAVSSGPIIRPKQFLPQFSELTIDIERVNAAILLICLGLCKKTAADLLDPTVASLFDTTNELSALEAWLAGIGYAAQLYADFSGYSDMAIGFAALLGLQIPLNFRMPFLATSFSDLWKRWHISLSTWLRDYLFLTIGIRTIYKSLFITWLLSGLWHGPKWTYVVWGLYQAIVLIVTAFIVKTFPLPRRTHKKLRIPKIILTFYLWLLGGILFRAATLERAWDIFVDMHSPVRETLWSFQLVMMLIMSAFVIVLFHAIDYAVINKKLECKSPGQQLRWAVVCILLLVFSFTISPGSPAFVYMNF